jgi:hypothetical protein
LSSGDDRPRREGRASGVNCATVGRFEFIWQYVGSCIGGAMPAGECAPLWQFGIIILLLVFAVAGLVVVRVLTSDDPAPRAASQGRSSGQKR